MGFVLAALAIVWLPGAVTWHLLSRRSETRFLRETGFLGERPLWASLFLYLATGLIIVGWLGLTLAQVGWFMPVVISISLGVYTLVCLGLLVWRPGIPKDEASAAIQSCHSERSEESPYASPETLRSAQGDRCGDGSYFRNRSPWETIVAAVLFIGALWLYSSLPAEYLPAFFDPGWYFNTGALIARTGALTFESQPFSALSPELKPLFFSSFSALRLDFPQLPESQQRGFFLTAFAVPDADDGAITPYHPPLLSIWLALFYAFGGLRTALYVPALFGALSLLAMFLAGRALFGRGPGLLAALLLALSLPQIYYSRTPYAEVVMQFLVLVGLYALTAVARGAGAAHAALAGLAFGQALLTKIEGLLVVIPLVIFWAVWLARRRSDFRVLLAFGLPFAALAGHALVLALTVNRVYVALNGFGVWSRLRVALGRPLWWLALAVAAGAMVSWILRHRRSWRTLVTGRWLTQGLPSPVRRAVAWGILLLAVYGYFVQPVAGPTVPGGLGASATPGLVQLGRFLSPWGLWLGLAGLVLLMDRGFLWHHVFFAALILTTGAITLAAPTISAAVSPLYAVRRQVPVVIPGCLLLASYTLFSGWQLALPFLIRNNDFSRFLPASACNRRLKSSLRALFRQALRPAHRSIPRREQGDKMSLAGRSRLSLALLIQGLSVLVLMGGLLGITRPYLRYREMRGTVAFVERLAGWFTSSALVLFESVSVDSHVGRFAAPLWAVHGVDTLLLSPLAPFSGEMDQALALLAPRYRAVYWVSASPHPPLMVRGYRFDLAGEELWESSAIPPDPRYPPQIEYLEMPFYIYEITEVSYGENRTRADWRVVLRR